ncbi:MAG: hypothetical protein AAF685_10285 [Cyanobacteria bacterium P01_C01_bin.89]
MTSFSPASNSPDSNSKKSGGWRWFLSPILLTLVSAIAIGAWQTYRYWGYFLVRPGLVDEIEDFAVVEKWGTLDRDTAEIEINWSNLDRPQLDITTTATTAWEDVVKDANQFCPEISNWFSTPSCLYNEATLYFDRQALVTPRTPQLNATELTQHYQALAKTDLIEVPQTSYLPYDFAVGLIVLGRDRQNQPIVFMGIQGGQVENDHYPYYELIFREIEGSPGEWTIAAQRTFYIDIAGYEQLDLGYWIFVSVMWFGLLSPIPLLFYAPRLWRSFKGNS